MLIQSLEPQQYMKNWMLLFEPISFFILKIFLKQFDFIFIFLFALNYYFCILRSFWCDNIKNNFLKTKKHGSIRFQTKIISKNNRYYEYQRALNKTLATKNRKTKSNIKQILNINLVIFHTCNPKFNIPSIPMIPPLLFVLGEAPIFPWWKKWSVVVVAAALA
jgi:hypothetical protein